MRQERPGCFTDDAGSARNRPIRGQPRAVAVHTGDLEIHAVPRLVGGGWWCEAPVRSAERAYAAVKTGAVVANAHLLLMVQECVARGHSCQV